MISPKREDDRRFKRGMIVQVRLTNYDDCEVHWADAEIIAVGGNIAHVRFLQDGFHYYTGVGVIRRHSALEILLEEHDERRRIHSR